MISLNPQRLYTTVEAMRIAHAAKLPLVTGAALARLCRTGKIRAAKVGGRWLISGESLMEYFRGDS